MRITIRIIIGADPENAYRSPDFFREVPIFFAFAKMENARPFQRVQSRPIMKVRGRILNPETVSIRGERETLV